MSGGPTPIKEVRSKEVSEVLCTLLLVFLLSFAFIPQSRPTRRNNHPNGSRPRQCIASLEHGSVVFGRAQEFWPTDMKRERPMIVLNVDGQVIVLVGTSQEMSENTGRGREGVWLVEDMLEEGGLRRESFFNSREAFFAPEGFVINEVVGRLRPAYARKFERRIGVRYLLKNDPCVEENDVVFYEGKPWRDDKGLKRGFVRSVDEDVLTIHPISPRASVGPFLVNEFAQSFHLNAAKTIEIRQSAVFHTFCLPPARVSEVRVHLARDRK